MCFRLDLGPGPLPATAPSHGMIHPAIEFRPHLPEGVGPKCTARGIEALESHEHPNQRNLRRLFPKLCRETGLDEPNDLGPILADHVGLNPSPLYWIRHAAIS